MRLGRAAQRLVAAFIFASACHLAAAHAADAQPVALGTAPSPTTSAPTTPRTLLVTGASTGIGRRITERFAASGWTVYATARKDADLAALARIPNVRPIRMDVTSDAEVAAAVETITKAGHGLGGLVNNAGIATVGSFAEMSPQEFDLLMQVNVYGPMRVTRAFMPLLVASRGRVTTIGSISGILSSPLLGAYSMSKHAIEAFGDSLAVQMAPLGVAVSIVEPGNYDSEIGRNAAARTGVTSRMTNRSQYKPPDEVADAVLQFFTEPTPKRRYLVVPNQHEAEITIRKQIEELAQLNEGHAYTYSRDELVKMLDEALANARPKTAN